MFLPPPPAPPPFSQKKKGKSIHPQAAVSRFWYRYHTRTPGKATSLFPRRLYKDLEPETNEPRASRRNATQSYEQARAECEAKVRAAIVHCERTNSRFCDDEFNIEQDFFSGEYNCLRGLIRTDYEESNSDDDEDDHNGALGSSASPAKVKQSLRAIRNSGLLANQQVTVSMSGLERYIAQKPRASTRIIDRHPPQSIHRLDWIFENPKFTVDGYSSFDIKQGTIGDCWWLAAVGNIAHRRDLMEKICVARDEECGVYGFVFHKDGEWISTVIDDNLYLKNQDFAQNSDIYDVSGKKARLHKKQNQTGSEALYFAKCQDENETWLPLLEKAYAKVHGDYTAIDGGWAGTAVEDLTGGVTTMILGNCVLRKERMWREMLGVDEERSEFVFALSASGTSGNSRKNGLVLSHAYSILKATEIEDNSGTKLKLLKIRNPWGQRADSGYGVWHGPWSDGSKEWTPDVLKKLRHEFADDGAFWMTFEDMLSNFKWIHRTRLFDERWTVAQQWMSTAVSWVPGFLKTKFIIEIKKEGMVVIVLSNLDRRYFQGLEGQYTFRLEFRLKSVGSDSVDFLTTAKISSIIDIRSVNCEVHLQPGTYEVIPKVTASYCPWNSPVEQVVKEQVHINPVKLQEVGLRYDLAHSKAGVLDEDEVLLQKRRKEKEKKRKKKVQEAKGGPPPPNQNELAQQAQQLLSWLQEWWKEINRSEKDKATGSDKEKVVPDVLEAAQGRSDSVKETQPGPPMKLLPGQWPGDLTVDPVSEAGEDKTRQTAKEPREPAAAQRNNNAKTDPSHKGDDTGKSREVPQPAPNPTPPQPQPEPEPLPPPPPPPDSLNSTKPPPVVPEDSDSDSNPDSDFESWSDSDSDADGDDFSKPASRWNPVCVMCLRVYAQDKEVSVKLAEDKPASVEIVTADEAAPKPVPGEPASSTELGS